ncbi:type IV pilin protein [Candidatus Avelusimicrobium caledoniensis]|uniref:type IV pilin protein n=1 Tax=Candidatus Avelusimicrobium caledoniensis TaxID=3416220 RepID=UPI003D12E6C5
MKNKQAFTLIELLVVVLIIGILAAVALPQYQKAVWKSRYVQAKTMGENLAQAEEIYYLANGAYTADVSALSIDVPAKNCDPNDGICSFSWGKCILLNSSPFVRCYVYKNGAYYLEYERWLEHSSYPNLKICAAFSTNASNTSNQVCKAETGRSSPTSPQDTRWLWHY